MARTSSPGFFGHIQILAERPTPHGPEQLLAARHTTQGQRVRTWCLGGATPTDEQWVAPEAWDVRGHEIWPADLTLLTVPTLKDRGWTEGLIRRFLGAPEGTAPNPYHTAGPPMRLYVQARALACEATPAFQAALATTRVRQHRARAVAADRAAQVLAWVAGLTIPVPQVDAATLCARACQHYNRGDHVPDWVLERQDWGRPAATPASEAAFLARITVNYLRHQLTNYEDLLERTFGAVGADDARLAIARKVFDAIADAYPALAEECQRQYARRVAGAGWVP